MLLKTPMGSIPVRINGERLGWIVPVELPEWKITFDTIALSITPGLGQVLKDCFFKTLVAKSVSTGRPSLIDCELLTVKALFSWAVAQDFAF